VVVLPLSSQTLQILEVIDLGLILTFLRLAVSLFAIWLGYRAVGKYLTRVGKRLHLEEHILNFIRLVTKIFSVWLSLMIVVQILGLPTDWFVGASALVGTAIGFGSTQTIGNFLAGLYILISRPFTVRDFVKIGNVEGQVEEISINYTMMYVMTRNLVKIPNMQILNSTITHFTKEGVIDYSFPLNYFDHSLNNERIINNVLEPVIEEFYKEYGEKLVDKPKYYLVDADQAKKVFSIRLFFKKGDARSLYNLHPVLLEMMLDRYYNEKVREVG
jgi:small-conductance mechanosensitive channel